jgi:centrin-3
LPKSPRNRQHEITAEENNEIKEVFELFDNDKDNQLDYHEFKVYLFLIVFLSIEHIIALLSIRLHCVP